MATFYLSSTYEDLQDYRRVVFDALRKADYTVMAMEDYVAADQRPVDKCLLDVERADIYIGLFAFRYGYVPPPQYHNPNGLSITELEFRHAETHTKPCLTFVMNDATPWPRTFDDAHTAEDKGEHIKTLRQYLLTERLASAFSSPHELSTLVLAAVTKHLEDKRKLEPPGTQEPHTTATVTWDIEKNGSPYPGLMHFTRKYAPVFFGRDAEVREVLDRVRFPEGRFLIISGASGTGKSSLVDAGVLPRIEESAIAGEKKPVCVRMVPSQGSHPFDALLRPLHDYVEHAGMNVYELAEQMVRQPAILPERIQEIVSKGLNGGDLVLFLDQMEELFTVRDRAQSHVFLSALYEAAHNGSLHVIATIRSDFLQYCHEHQDLLRVLNGRGHIGLGPIDMISVGEMIVKPAQCAGLSIPHGLVRRLAGEKGQEPGGLPLLAFALRQLFEKRDGNRLTEKAYDDLGGLAGAIGEHVKTVEEKVGLSLATDDEGVFSKIFALLIVVNIDGQPTRRRHLRKILGLI